MENEALQGERSRAPRSRALRQRARLDPGPSGPLLAVRLRWPQARITSPWAGFPGARSPSGHPFWRTGFRTLSNQHAEATQIAARRSIADCFFAAFFSEESAYSPSCFAEIHPSQMALRGIVHPADYSRVYRVTLPEFLFRTSTVFSSTKWKRSTVSLMPSRLNLKVITRSPVSSSREGVPSPSDLRVMYR